VDNTKEEIKESAKAKAIHAPLTSYHQSADDQVYFRFDFASTQNGLQCQQRASFMRTALYHLDGTPFVAGSCRASAPQVT
jgi:hypothetical protein